MLCLQPNVRLPAQVLQGDVALPVKHPPLPGTAHSPLIWLWLLFHVNIENAICLGVCDFVSLYKIWVSVLASSLFLAVSRLILKGQILFPVSSDYRGIEPYAKDLQWETHTAHIPDEFPHVALGDLWKRGTLFSMETVIHLWTTSGFGAQGRSLICTVYEVPAWHISEPLATSISWLCDQTAVLRTGQAALQWAQRLPESLHYHLISSLGSQTNTAFLVKEIMLPLWCKAPHGDCEELPGLTLSAAVCKSSCKAEASGRAWLGSGGQTVILKGDTYGQGCGFVPSGSVQVPCCSVRHSDADFLSASRFQSQSWLETFQSFTPGNSSFQKERFPWTLQGGWLNSGSESLQGKHHFGGWGVENGRVWCFYDPRDCSWHSGVLPNFLSDWFVFKGSGLCSVPLYYTYFLKTKQNRNSYIKPLWFSRSCCSSLLYENQTETDFPHNTYSA